MLLQASTLVPNNLSTSFMLMKEKAIRRLKEKIAEEKKICQTMRWRDYNQGNLSAFDRDLGPVEVKMRQITNRTDNKSKMKRRRSKRFGDIVAVSWT